MKNCRVAQAFLEAGYWCHEVGKKRRTSQPALEGSTFGYAYIPLVAMPAMIKQNQMQDSQDVASSQAHYEVSCSPNTAWPVPVAVFRGKVHGLYNRLHSQTLQEHHWLERRRDAIYWRRKRNSKALQLKILPRIKKIMRSSVLKKSCHLLSFLKKKSANQSRRDSPISLEKHPFRLPPQILIPGKSRLNDAKDNLTLQSRKQSPKSKCHAYTYESVQCSLT